MTTKLIIKWALLAPVSLFMAIFARLLCPVLPLFADDEGYLPEWLWWFQTPFDTLDGDNGSWERHPGTGTLQTYWRRVCWLWRNTGISGKCRWYAYRSGKLIAWQWYYCQHYDIFGIHKCVRIGFGWKIWSEEKLYDEPAQYWFYINPVK